MGVWYQTAKYLRSIPNPSSLAKQELERLTGLIAKHRPTLDLVNQLYAESDAQIAKNRQLILAQQKYDLEVIAEQQRIQVNNDKVRKLDDDLARLNQQLKFTPHNQKLSLAIRQKEREKSDLQIESDRRQAILGIKDDLRTGKIDQEQYNKRLTAINKSASDRRRNAQELQAQKSKESKLSFDDLKNQFIYSARAERLTGSQIELKGMQITNRELAPFADDRELVKQRDLSLAEATDKFNRYKDDVKKRLRPLTNSDESIEVQLEKYKGDELVNTISQEYTQAQTNFANSKENIYREYGVNMRQHDRDRQAYAFNQEDELYRGKLAIYQAGAIDSRKMFGLNADFQEYTAAVLTKKQDYNKRRTVLNQQLSAIKSSDDLEKEKSKIVGNDADSVQKRKEIDHTIVANEKTRSNLREMINDLDRMEKIDMSNLTAQFDPLNQALAETQKATKELFSQLAMTGKFDVGKFLQGLLGSLTNEVMERATSSMFEGLYRRPNTGEEKQKTLGLVDLIFGGVAQAAGFKFANGGIAPGGFRAFATGGVVKTPTIGLVGEGVYNEAVVPLPDGKSIPVVMNQNQGSSGSISSSVSVTVNNNGSGERSTTGNTNQLSNAIEAAVMNVLARERRSGGLAY